MTTRERIFVLSFFILTILSLIIFVIWMNPLTGILALMMSMISFLFILHYGKPL
ncbi:hypothetical protein SEA_QUARAN19_37 [Streptomyces phage Quaran19]|nr:membrane protein [Streptomyces phage SaltySpitoon]URM87565.1 hypothetical protein SEA_QUARAN19_37 [Streptomyces phage Quaran19]